MALENTETQPAPADETGANPPTAHRTGRGRRRRRSFVRRIARQARHLIRLRIIVAALVVLITLPTVGVIAYAVDSNARVQDSLGNLRRTFNTINRRSITNLTLNDITRMQVSLNNFVSNLAYARQNTVVLQRFAFLNPDLTTTFELLDAAEQLARAATDMLNGLQPALYYLVEGKSDVAVGGDITSGERVVELLELGRSRFASAARRLDATQRFIDNLPTRRLSPAVLLMVRELTDYYRQMRTASRVLNNAPDIISAVFGLSEPIDYLILSQNSDELRPSGGYISTYGWMRVRRFRIADFGYAASSDISPNPPPEALANELDIPAWWIQYPRPIYTAWDGSWYADFPSTARMAAWFYNNGRNPRSPIDAVIGIDIKGFEYLLEGIGGVIVPGYDLIVTGDNFREVIYTLRASNAPGDPYKEFLATLYRRIIGDWQTLAQTRSQPMLEALFRALQEKHVMLYFSDPALDEVVSLLGWSGAQNQGNTDYLMVADTNMGNKSNSAITRAITHDVRIEADGTTQSRLTLTYDYSAIRAEQDPAVRPEHYGNQKDYTNLLQIFVPKGSAITATNNLPGEVKIGEGLNRQIFVTLVRVNYDTTERFQVSYRTPAVVEPFGEQKRYRLLIQKQPGTPGDEVNVQVTLPEGAQLISISPDPATSYTLDRRILEFKLRLTTDQWIDIIFN